MDLHTLIVTAHPDDETIFFGGLLISRPKSSTHVVCLTNGNADLQGEKRRADFISALEQLEVTGEMLDFPDVYESRLNTDEVIESLSKYHPSEVFTHNIVGEYGHPHHQDTSFAVHKHFHDKAKVFSTAYNSFPTTRIELSEQMWNKKLRILSHEYWSETSRFLQYIPCSWSEGFSETSFNEVEAIYKAFVEQSQPREKDLNRYKPLNRYIENWALKNNKRPF